MSADKILTLDLFEYYKLDELLSIQRVHTGWIYYHYEQVFNDEGEETGMTLKCTTFVPLPTGH